MQFPNSVTCVFVINIFPAKRVEELLNSGWSAQESCGWDGVHTAVHTYIGPRRYRLVSPLPLARTCLVTPAGEPPLARCLSARSSARGPLRRPTSPTGLGLLKLNFLCWGISPLSPVSEGVLATRLARTYRQVSTAASHRRRQKINSKLSLFNDS
jgi:hypothetical protein